MKTLTVQTPYGTITGTLYTALKLISFSLEPGRVISVADRYPKTSYEWRIARVKKERRILKEKLTKLAASKGWQPLPTGCDFILEFQPAN